jgi:glycolate oxidase FAD binding subunit
MSAPSVPAELTSAGEVTPARESDAVAGTPARYVAAPASTPEAAAVMKAAAALGLSVVPRGTGSKLSWGSAPTVCDLLIDTGKLGQVISHEAGDLVVSVQAGVQLTALAEVLDAAGQRLALDPPALGTIGGLIATNAAGPLRFRYGTPRDLLIGITVVRADGTIAHSGGKVVKNVAGYDLGKLFAGSYGTLGLITEATFRLHPKPAAATVVTMTSPDPQSAAAAALAAASSQLAPSAIELDWPSNAAPVTVGVLLEGDEASVQERASRMQSLLTDEREAGRPSVGAFPAFWRRRTDGSPALMVRVTCWPAQLANALTAIRAAAAGQQLDPSISGSAAAGVLQVELGPNAPASAAAAFVTALRSGLSALAAPADGAWPGASTSVVVVSAPPEVRSQVDMSGAVPALALMQSVKDQFDPEHRMAPGRAPGGI